VPFPRALVDWLALPALPALPVLPALPALPALPLLPALLDVPPVSMRGVASPDSYPHRPTPSVPLSHFAFRTPLAALMLYPHNADVPSRFNKLLYVVDTCQANTMFSKFYSPNIISTGSSSLGENSYSVSDLIHRTQPTLSFRLATNTTDHEECSPSVSMCRSDPC
jgi:hypothetical protein